jgi:hypothetical protein
VAQVDRARLNGTVVDTSGRALPQAHITAVQNATGLRRETISSPSGTYDIPELPVGIYDVSFVHDGFKALTFVNVVQTVGRTRILNATLHLSGGEERAGGVGEFRAVGYDIGRAADTRGTDADQGIASQRQALVLADGGIAVRGRYRRQQPAGDADSRAGAAMTITLLTTASTPPTSSTSRNKRMFDAIEEFRVDSMLATAEAGGKGGPQLAATSPSGTNQWHGGTFEFFRNNVFDARQPVPNAARDSVFVTDRFLEASEGNEAYT